MTALELKSATDDLLEVCRKHNILISGTGGPIRIIGEANNEKIPDRSWINLSLLRDGSGEVWVIGGYGITIEVSQSDDAPPRPF